MSPIPLAVRQGTPAWIDARRDAIGSSDIPILTGNSPYRSSPFDLWCYKTRLLEAAPVDPLTEELWALGHALEPVIAERYTVMTGRPVRRVMQMLRHPDIEWATASLDRRDARKGEHRIVELKWVPWKRWEEGPEAVPAYVQDQVQWQLMVTGFDAADVAVLMGSHVEHHEVMPDRAYQDDLLIIARAFRLLVETGERPAIDGSEATRRALVRLHPRDDGSYMAATAELTALMAEWRESEVAAASATSELARVKNAIRGVLEAHTGAESDAWKVTFARSKDGTKTAWEAVARAYRRVLEDIAEIVEPEELDAIESLHTTPTEGSRSLRVTWRSEPNEEGSWT